MSIVSRFRGWLRRRRQRRDLRNAQGQLREFVYLDEVSVYSILASRKGGIPTEFTESQTASLNSEVGGALGVGFGATKAKLDSKVKAGHVQGSQVVRKAIIQTSFKELYDIERDALALSPPHAGSVPTVNTVADLERDLDRLSDEGWLFDPGAMHRGEILEVEVELEADPIFRMASVIATIREIVEDNERLFEQAITTGLSDMRSMAQVLESLLVGLVPIRGRLVDYKWSNIGGRDVLIHRSLLDQMHVDARPIANSVFVVGVVQRDLFWKDIRRVLFSGAQYTVFCRVAVSGLADSWRPIKVADVLAGIVPRFDELVGEFSEAARVAMAGAYASPTSVAQGADCEMQAIRKYAALLIGHHGGTLDPETIDELIHDISREGGWLDSVDGRRAVFGEVTRRVDAAIEVETSREVAYEFRRTVTSDKRALDGTVGPQATTGREREPAPDPRRLERFMDAEIVAIYW